MEYEITEITPTTYLGANNKVIEGVTVYVRFPEFNETHNFRLPEMNAEQAHMNATRLLTERRAIQQLGRSTGHD